MAAPLTAPLPRSPPIPRLRSRLVHAACLILGLWLTACGGGAGPQSAHPNLVLITVDSLRADRVGFAGYKPAATPRMDALAARGTVYTRAMTTAPEAAPALASLFTGLYPATHGVRTSQDGALPASAVTLATALKGQGYRTGAVASALALHRKYGFDQGFDSYVASFEDAPRPSQLTEAGYPAEKVAAMALEFLQTARGGPFFLWVNFFDPHYFYSPPEPFASQFKEQPYDGEIAYVDREMGRILDKLKDYGIDGGTVVVLAGTNGEGLGDHGEAYHGATLTDATTRVPLVIVAPGVASGGRVETPVSLVDVAPTLLDLMGLGALTGAEGVSVAAARVSAIAPDRPIYMEASMPRRLFGWLALTGVVSGRWKYVSGVRGELEDLSDPAGAGGDVSAAHPDVRDRLAALAAAYAARGDAAERAARAIPADVAERIRSLGYPVEAAARTPRDPRDMVAVANDALKADRTARRRQLQAASMLLQQVFMRDPDNRVGLVDTALLAGAMGDAAARRRLLERAQTLYPGSSEIYRQLGYCDLMERKPGGSDRACALFEIATRLDPANEEALYDLACCNAVRKQPGRALDLLEAAVKQGFRDFEFMGNDTDLDSLRSDPRFETITAGKAHKPEAKASPKKK